MSDFSSKGMRELLLRSGVMPSDEYWGRENTGVSSFKPPRRRSLRENTETVAEAATGSLEDLLRRAVKTVAVAIEGGTPENLKSRGTSIDEMPGAVMVYRAKGTTLDVMETRLRVEIASDGRFVTAVVDFDDGVYNPADMKRERERFAIDQSAPLSDLTDLVTRWLLTRAGR